MRKWPNCGESDRDRQFYKLNRYQLISGSSLTSSKGLSMTTYPFFRRILWIWEPFTIINPRFLVGRSFSPSLYIFSIYVAWSIIKFIDLSQLFSFPNTSLPPLNFTTISWFSIYLNLISDYFDTRMLRPIPLISLSIFYYKIISSLYPNNPLNCSNSMR